MFSYCTQLKLFWIGLGYMLEQSAVLITIKMILQPVSGRQCWKECRMISDKLKSTRKFIAARKYLASIYQI